MDYIGTWESVSSEINGYIPGREWLHIRSGGHHTWETLHPPPSEKSNIIDFEFRETFGELRMIPKRRGKGLSSGWRIGMKITGVNELEVVGPHELKTIFRRIDV